MANITFLRSAGGVTVNSVAHTVTTAIIEVLSGDVWVTMTNGAQYRCTPGTDTITVNGSSFAGTAAQLRTKLMDEVFYALTTKSDIEKAIIAMGGSIFGQTVGLNVKTAITANSLASGAVRFEPIIASATGSATGLRFNVATQGVYTANNFNGVALYTYNAGVLTQVAISADTPNAWTAAVGYLDIPFTAPIQINEGTLYFAVWMYSSSAQTTAPGLRGIALGGTAAYPLANSSKLHAVLNGQTALPASGVAMSALNSSSITIWAAIY